MAFTTVSALYFQEQHKYMSHFFLNYKYITKIADIRLVRDISLCFICIPNSINWLILKMRVIADPLSNENFMKMNISDDFIDYISSYPQTKRVSYHKSRKSIH